MFIQCTKKLLEQLGVKPASVEEGETLFSWHANLIMVNRRKTVVFTNDLNRYVVVLHGLKAKDFKKLGELFLNGLKDVFQKEGIKEELIEKYLLQSKEITFSKTKNRTLVARLNKACENVEYFSDYLDEGAVFQSSLSTRISSLLVGDGKNYFYPNEAFYKDFEEFAGEPIFSSIAVQLKVSLNLEKHHVWRRLIVPVNRTFESFHEILQAAFEWKGYHSHEFYIYDNPASGQNREKPILNLVCDEEAFEYPSNMEMRHEKGIPLSEYIPLYKKLMYRYDFGDDWQHDIEVEQIIEDYDAPYPVCIEGEGNTPPEDVGGQYGYEAFLATMENPEHPDYQHMSDWARMQGYKKFDIEQVNRRLK